MRALPVRVESSEPWVTNRLQLDGGELLLRGRRTLHAALAKRSTVSLHWPREASSREISPGQVSERKSGGSNKKGEALSRTRVLDLLVELERLARKVSADVEEYPVVVMKSLERSGAGEVRGRFNLYAVAPQNANSYVACRLVVVDEQNLLAFKNRVATTK